MIMEEYKKDLRVPIKFKGRLSDIGELQVYERKNKNKNDIHKRLLTINVNNEGQILFVEARNSGLKKLKDSGVKIGDNVEIEVYFEGNIFEDKWYNNIIMCNIK